MVAAIDGWAPSNGLDGTGSLFLGEGWGRPEGSVGGGDWGSMAWVVGREALIHVLLPPASEVDFFARCLPYPWAPESPQQDMEVLVDRKVVGRLELVRDWQDVRLPLPEALPRNQLLTLRLRFAHALKPLDLGESDPRSLAAAFTRLAVIPRSVREPGEFLEAHALDPETGRVALPPAGGLRLPVPPESLISVQLSGVSSELSLELTRPSGSPRRFRVKPGTEVQTVRFETGPRGIQSLWIQALDKGQGSPAPRTEFVLGEVGRRTRRPTNGPVPQPQIFLYVIDTLRADALVAYGGDLEIAPQMNAFAREAATYLNARAPSSWTLPSVVSLLTGLDPDRHGVMAGKLQYDPDRHESLQQLLGDRGYRTVGISQSFIVSSSYGVDAGFGSFFLSDHLNGHQLRSQEARGMLVSWLSQSAEESPIFAYLHTVDPHSPYSPPPDLREAAGAPPPGQLALEAGVPSAGQQIDSAGIAYLRALYEGEVRYADREFGRFVELLKWLGLYDGSYVILTADHGEEFAEHGGFEHGRTLFEEVLRIPLIVKYPNARWAGQRIESPVSLVDLAPTLLPAHAERSNSSFDGEALPGPTGPRRRAIYFEIAPANDPDSNVSPVDQRGLALGEIKCIEDRAAGVDRGGKQSPRLLAFHLGTDPGEQQPLAPDSLEAAQCRELLDSWTKTRERQVKQQRSQREATPETLERLRALGYLK